MSQPLPILLVIAGPTAVGKTTLSIDVAKRFGTEILSADSRQFYREMRIGTARPTLEEMDGVPHHFVGQLPVTEDYTAGRFETDALQVLNRLFKEKRIVVLAGGSGLFIKAITEGIDPMPAIDPEIRAELMKRLESEGLEALCEKLSTLDPDYYAEVDKQNPRRVIRGLEVVLSSGQRYSDFRRQKPKERPFQTVGICLDRPRPELHRRINERVDAMMAEGLEAEARSLYHLREQNALQTVGYRELFAHFDGEISHKEAVEKIKASTRQFARRQLTWFRKQSGFEWFHPDDQEGINAFLTTMVPVSA